MTDKVSKAWQGQVQGSPGSKRGRRGRKRSRVSPNPVNKPTEDQLPPGSKAMQDAVSNDLILKCIFKHFRTPNLVKDCRLVNAQWNRVATEVLKKRHDAYIKVNSETDFKALTALIKSSSDFPFREIHLQIWKTDFRSSPEKWLEVELFRQHSTLFTSLRLSVSRAPDIVVTSLFSGPLNHIVSLTLNYIRRPEEEQKKDKKKKARKSKPFCDGNGKRLSLSLPKLKVIAMKNDSECSEVDPTFLEGLLQCCPNLVRACNFSNKHLRALSAAGKLEAVKSLRVCSCINKDSDYPRPSGVEILTLIESHYGVYVDDDDHDDDYVMEFASLQPLLESNHESLRCIEVECEVIGGPSSNDWPILSNLTSLKLMNLFYFPASVEAIFPALKKIQFGNCRIPSNYGGYRGICDFLWDDPLPSVTTLEVFYCLYQRDWDCISEALPNVRHIYLKYDTCEYHAEKKSVDERVIDPWDGVSRFEQLETLYISSMGLPGTDLDEFLTGLPEAFVEKLRKNPQLPVPAPEYIDTMLRKGKSIVSLPGLKELVVFFNISDRVTTADGSTSCLVSHVAMDYALNMIPMDLKVQFRYDQFSPNAHLIDEALLPLSGRVTFAHWNANLEH